MADEMETRESPGKIFALVTPVPAWKKEIDDIVGKAFDEIESAVENYLSCQDCHLKSLIRQYDEIRKSEESDDVWMRDIIWQQIMEEI